MADVLMTQAMRWFGPRDPVPLAHIRQAGATHVVTALHHIPNGMVWPREEIAAQRAMIERAGLGWTTVESVPVHEAIKTAGAERDRLIDQYTTTLRHLAAEGITIVTYNFMPLLDWTRTDLAWELPDGARALRFELDAVAAYDLHLLRRPGAEADYAPDTIERAARRFAAMDDEAKLRLERTIIAGLPGSEESFTSAQFLDAIHDYADTGPDQLRANHHAFMAAICPVAEELGIRMVVHPDDPPFPIFGLPRVVSTEADVTALFEAVPSTANGLCFCTGSFGVRADNDLPGMVRRLGERIGFLHLRSVQREPDGAFHEAAHLEGSGDLTAVMAEVVALQRREGRSIVMRPDHGHQMIDDLTKVTNPGYSLLGRMRGLAELRGLERGLAFMGAK
ncbi:mannonate dehydratase [Sphingomonas endophytica]|uniref:Mannonate dehydratase n=1 Tax=Sphingomonas endophytica TaxID=869719 RepID=A0A7X0MNL0_9SPHN|nr:mannonate dehydratase [Sphingomonas endophytica]MBB6505474.1 mannonate dehydratase [Sphingomonas endophytica]